VKESNPSRRALANLLEVLQSLGQTGMLDRLDDYAAAAAQLAAVDISIMDGHGSQDEMLETAVIATLLGDVLVSLLRRMAQESTSTKYRDPPPNR
jgi:tellurite resistance protein